THRCDETGFDQFDFDRVAAFTPVFFDPLLQPAGAIWIAEVVVHSSFTSSGSGKTWVPGTVLRGAPRATLQPHPNARSSASLTHSEAAIWRGRDASTTGKTNSPHLRHLAVRCAARPDANRLSQGSFAPPPDNALILRTFQPRGGFRRRK